jgi:hypothetical protein
MAMQISKEAGAAWAAKDYARVAELFQPVRDELTEINRKRLEYAEKRSGLRVGPTNSKSAGRGWALALKRRWEFLRKIRF